MGWPWLEVVAVTDPREQEMRWLQPARLLPVLHSTRAGWAHGCRVWVSSGGHKAEVSEVRELKTRARFFGGSGWLLCSKLFLCSLNRGSLKSFPFTAMQSSCCRKARICQIPQNFLIHHSPTLVQAGRGKVLAGHQSLKMSTQPPQET